MKQQIDYKLITLHSIEEWRADSVCFGIWKSSQSDLIYTLQTVNKPDLAQLSVPCMARK